MRAGVRAGEIVCYNERVSACIFESLGRLLWTCGPSAEPVILFDVCIHLFVLSCSDGDFLVSTHTHTHTQMCYA